MIGSPDSIVRRPGLCERHKKSGAKPSALRAGRVAACIEHSADKTQILVTVMVLELYVQIGNTHATQRRIFPEMAGPSTFDTSTPS